MKKSSSISRRRLFKDIALGTALFGLAGTSASSASSLLFADEIADSKPEGFKGNIRQSVSKWCFGSVPMDELCAKCKSFGMVGIDLVDPNAWEAVGKAGMIVTMGNVPGASIPTGFNRLENHDKLVAAYEKYIPMAAELNVPNLICFSGNKAGLDDELGIENCVIGLKRVMPIAEKHGVTIVMELLNSKDHTDYHADSTPWAAQIVEKLGSDRFRLLYDIYHMQRMEGDVINNIRKYKDAIGHYHTAGNPGRRDLDADQELNYVPIMKAILATGFKGFVAHEFSPKNGLDSLKRAVELCDV